MGVQVKGRSTCVSGVVHMREGCGGVKTCPTVLALRCSFFHLGFVQ